jgi:hypothetical protein
MPVPTGTVYLNNDWEFDYEFQQRNATTRRLEGATGLTGVQGWWSLTDGGVALAGTTTALTEASATLAPGRYTGVLDAAAVNTALTTLAGKVVYEVIAKSGDVATSRPYLVAAVRRPADS